jgi:hypothetical protein
MEIGRIGDPLARAARRSARAVPAVPRFRTTRVKRIDACGCAMGHGFPAGAASFNFLVRLAMPCLRAFHESRPTQDRLHRLSRSRFG